MSTNTGLSSCCLSGKLSQSDRTPAGFEETIGGVPTYVARPSSLPQAHSKHNAVVFLVDIFGWKLPNIRLLADQYAAAGFVAYVPDVHENDSLPIEFLDTVEPPLPKRESLGVTEKAAATAKTGATLGPWLIKHREAVARPIVEGFVNAVRVVPGTEKVGVIGFCWGGRYALLCGQTPFSGLPGKGVDAVYACHPSLLSIPSDLENVVVPTSLAVGDKDSLLSMDDVEKIKDVLAKKERGEQGEKLPAQEVKVYEDQIHGFALRGDWSSEKDKKAMDQAEKQGIEWFKKYLVTEA